MLPAVLVQILVKVALAIVESDADQRDTEVGGALDVIARQYAQSTGIDRHRFMQAELR